MSRHSRNGSPQVRRLPRPYSNGAMRSPLLARAGVQRMLDLAGSPHSPVIASPAPLSSHRFRGAADPCANLARTIAGMEFAAFAANDEGKGLLKMVNPPQRGGGQFGGGEVTLAQFVELTTSVKEKLIAMEAMSQERSRGVEHIASVQAAQAIQITQLVTDMAILKTQHASFWKGLSVLLGVLALMGGGIGWIVGQVISMHH